MTCEIFNENINGCWYGIKGVRSYSQPVTCEGILKLGDLSVYETPVSDHFIDRYHAETGESGFHPQHFAKFMQAHADEVLDYIRHSAREQREYAELVDETIDEWNEW